VGGVLKIAGGSVVIVLLDNRSFILLSIETIPAKMSSSSKPNNYPEISATNTLSYLEPAIFSLLPCRLQYLCSCFRGYE
jgi:hypothetical protein